MKKTITDPKYLKLLAWLKESREGQSLSVRQLGEALGVANSFVTKIELAERRLDVFEYVQYCRALGLDPKAGLKLLE